MQPLGRERGHRTLRAGGHGLKILDFNVRQKGAAEAADCEAHAEFPAERGLKQRSDARCDHEIPQQDRRRQHACDDPQAGEDPFCLGSHSASPSTGWMRETKPVKRRFRGTRSGWS